MFLSMIIIFYQRNRERHSDITESQCNTLIPNDFLRTAIKKGQSKEMPMQTLA